MNSELLLRIAHERQSREREIRALERLVHSSSDSSLRRRIGESVIRLGQRLAANPDPVWSR